MTFQGKTADKNIQLNIRLETMLSLMCYRKVPKFSDARKLCCNLKVQTKRANLRVFRQKDAKGIANSEDPDQTAPLAAV